MFKEITTGEKHCLDLLRRARDDFINYKNRVERERGEQAKFAKAELIVKLLPVLGDFYRAEGAMPADIAHACWASVIDIIEENLVALLEEEGVSKIEAMGEVFNPELHEALSYEESDEYEEGIVKAVLANGYRLNGRVIRPAQVAQYPKEVERLRIPPE